MPVPRGAQLYLLVECSQWNAQRHAEALQRYAPPGWNVEIALWNQDYHKWAFDNATVIANIGSNWWVELRNLQKQRAPTAILISRFNTCYPRYFGKFVRLVANSDAIIVESQFCYDRIKAAQPDLIAEHKVFRVPTGVDTELFCAEPGPRGRRALWCAGTLNQSPERSLVKRVGFARALKIELAKDDIVLDIFEVDPNGPDVRTPEQMRDWYNSGRVFVCTSILEGLPNTVLEAAACGCAIVSTPVGIVPELEDEDSRGLYICPPTVKAFASAIRCATNTWTDEESPIPMIEDWGWKFKAGDFFQAIDELVCIRQSNIGQE